MPSEDAFVPPGTDANLDAYSAMPFDAGRDASHDAGADATHDAGSDAGPCSRCPAATPACAADGLSCVQCSATNASACMGATPACNPAANTCVECTSTSLAACTGTTPACDSDNTCTCTPSSCTSRTASRCDTASNDCAPCMADSDCAHTGAPRCVAGTCRACTVLTEAADCGANSCNPTTNACTDTPRASRTVCQTCVADSDCAPNHTCAAVNPARGITGSYCLPIRTTICSAVRPYLEGTSEVNDRGVMVNYCRSATTTCEAVLHHRTAQPTSGAATPRCTNEAPAALEDAACGAPGLADGVCRMSSGGLNRCTYPCTGDDDCPCGVPSGTCTVSCVGGYCSI